MEPKVLGQSLSMCLIVLVPSIALAQDGEVIYQTLYAACHTNPPEKNIPRIDALQVLDPKMIVDSLTSGVMSPQGLAISNEKRVEVAEYITGQKVR